MSEKFFSEDEVVMLLTDMMMVHMGDEWVPQLDDGYCDFLIQNNLYNTFLKIYQDDEN